MFVGRGQVRLELRVAKSLNPNNKMEIVIFLDKSNDEDWLTTRDCFSAKRLHSFTAAITCRYLTKSMITTHGNNFLPVFFYIWFVTRIQAFCWSLELIIIHFSQVMTYGQKLLCLCRPCSIKTAQTSTRWACCSYDHQSKCC